MKIKITKMNGSGNDFIIVDNRSGFLKDVSVPDLARIICRRRESVGADGLILIENSEIADFKWRFFNADGSEAEMCGNGGRCVARYAFLNRISGANLTFETIAGVIRAKTKKERVQIELPTAKELNLHRFISLDDQTIRLSTINTGVPHAVICVEEIENVPVKDLGRKIRFHPEFQPAGTNVTFIRVIDSSNLVIRTYERGVEDETLACGTGAVGSALVTAAAGKTKSPVKVKTQGGEVLTVSFQKDENDSFSQVFLEGDTCLVFEGTAGEDVWRQYENAFK
ncbi:MAG: diaminopimelate epimerase [Proteobacteria bacterium]|nr:diaminopimelate epimerase [Pseudomonadota bacterium]